MTHIFENIYIGDMFDAHAQHTKFKAILCCAKELSLINHQLARQLPLTDTFDDDLITHLVEGYEFIEETINTSEGNVLVYCQAGKSRSVSMVVYYLIKKLDMNLDEAIEFVKQKRPIIDINKDYIRQLQNYYDML